MGAILNLKTNIQGLASIGTDKNTLIQRMRGAITSHLPFQRGNGKLETSTPGAANGHKPSPSTVKNFQTPGGYSKSTVCWISNFLKIKGFHVIKTFIKPF